MINLLRKCESKQNRYAILVCLTGNYIDVYTFLKSLNFN